MQLQKLLKTFVLVKIKTIFSRNVIGFFYLHSKTFCAVKQSNRCPLKSDLIAHNVKCTVEAAKTNVNMIY